MSPERKRFYAILIIVVFSLIIVMELGNFRAKQLAEGLAGDQATKAAGLAVESLNGTKVKEIIAAGDENYPYYAEIRARLIGLKKEHDLVNIYILYKNEDGTRWYDVADALEEGDPAHNPLGTAEKSVSASVDRTYKGFPVQAEYHIASAGPLVSSYQVIKDARGRTIAVLGADFGAGRMTDFLYFTRYIQLGIIAIGLALIGFISYFPKKIK